MSPTGNASSKRAVMRSALCMRLASAAQAAPPVARKEISLEHQRAASPFGRHDAEHVVDAERLEHERHMGRALGERGSFLRLGAEGETGKARTSAARGRASESVCATWKLRGYAAGPWANMASARGFSSAGRTPRRSDAGNVSPERPARVSAHRMTAPSCAHPDHSLHRALTWPPCLRRGAGVVERGGLENRCGRKSTQGSNPCLSATHPIPVGSHPPGPFG
jgi:hypothetical protein